MLSDIGINLGEMKAYVHIEAYMFTVLADSFVKAKNSYVNSLEEINYGIFIV